MHAICAHILHHALGVQSENAVTLPASLVEAADSHVYALWPEAAGSAICNDMYYAAGLTPVTTQGCSHVGTAML